MRNFNNDRDMVTICCEWFLELEVLADASSKHQMTFAGLRCVEEWQEQDWSWVLI